MNEAERITASITEADGAAICAYVTAGFPSREEFGDVLSAVAAAADVVEIGVPFTDPMADGLTIQESSRTALEDGVSLRWILDFLASVDLSTPHVLMGYFNPFLAFGLDQLIYRMGDVGLGGLIVPDLPREESGPLAAVLDPAGLALIQLVAPSTSDERLSLVATASQGFVYAVTTTGVTGGRVSLPVEALHYLDRVKMASTLPVLAGFGVREAGQVEELAAHVDGVVVGSALIEVIDRGEDPGEFIRSLRATTVSA